MCPKNEKVIPITITNPMIEDYCIEHASHLPDELYEIEQYTKENILAHRMLSSHIQAYFLIALSKMITPKRVLEIGTFTGYSAICLAQGLREDGQLITIEKKAEFVKIAGNFFDKYQYQNIQVIEGNAMELIDSLQPTFDLIYLDADKENYIDYYKKLLPLLSENGWMVIDNTLWKGLVSDTPREPVTEKMQAFNDYIARQENIFSFIIPVRDGITLIQKQG